MTVGKATIKSGVEGAERRIHERVYVTSPRRLDLQVIEKRRRIDLQCDLKYKA